MNLIEGLQAQMNRVRGIIAVYDTIPAGFIASSLMKIDIQHAEHSIAMGDTIAMMQAYSKLEEYEDL